MTLARKALGLSLGAAFLLVAGQTAALAEGAEAKDPKAGWYTDVVDLAFVKEHAVIPIRDDVVTIDSRPTRKYDAGYIPGAVNIPDTRFDKMTDLLPEDKSKLLIFYCGGEKCMLSHKSAFKAEKLGYTNIKVFAAGLPAWIKDGNLASISAARVKKLIDKKADVVLVDSRPARRFKGGSVPTAISIPDTRFAKMTDMLPAEKDKELIFFCGGNKCPLSTKSAAKAEDLGYTKVKVFQAGYPAWVKAYGKSEPVMAAADGPAKEAGAAKVAIKTGDEPEIITIESFKQIVEQAPEMVHLIDVRDPEEVESGAFKTAVNIPVDTIEDQVAELPDDKPIVFVCSTGARSGEAYDIVSLEREDLKMYFLDAEVTFSADGSYEITPPAM